MLDLLGQRLLDCSDLESVLSSALSEGLRLSGTDLGNIQLVDGRTGYLAIAAQRGFNDEFLNFFHRVRAEDGSACGRAMRERRPIVISDVMFDQDFAPCRAIALRAGFRAVQSTPLVSSSGLFVGILSTHFPTTRQPADGEMQMMQRLGELTANAIIHQRASAHQADGHATTEAAKVAEQVRRGQEAMERFDDLMRDFPRRPER